MPAAARSPSRKRTGLIWYAAIPAAAVLFWCAPLFHIVPLQAARDQTAEAAFSADAFVEKLWNDRLLKSPGKAVDAATLLAAINKDIQAAHQKYGRSLGLSSTYYYFLSGQGRVVAVEKNLVSLAVNPASDKPDIVLETGNVFGNAVRDGTGLLNVNDFPNSQDFNDISAQINRRIEERVLPALRAKAAVGAVVRFAGCAEITNEDADLHPLRLVPLIAEVQPGL
jgi:predicted lipoprotein